MAILYDHSIASFDTEFQPTGHTRVHGFPPRIQIEMKKHHHELHLVISGPDGQDVSNCLNSVATGPLLAPVVAAYLAKIDVAAAEAVVLGPLNACLGQGFAASFEDRPSWQTWWP